MLGRLDQPSLSQNPHVMRNRRLRELYARFDIPAAQTRSVNVLRSWRFTRRSFFQEKQNPAARRICDGVQSTIKRMFRGHADYRYRGNR